MLTGGRAVVTIIPSRFETITEPELQRLLDGHRRDARDDIHSRALQHADRPRPDPPHKNDFDLLIRQPARKNTRLVRRRREILSRDDLLCLTIHGQQSEELGMTEMLADAISLDRNRNFDL